MIQVLSKVAHISIFYRWGNLYKYNPGSVRRCHKQISCWPTFGPCISKNTHQIQVLMKFWTRIYLIWVSIDILHAFLSFSILDNILFENPVFCKYLLVIISDLKCKLIISIKGRLKNMFNKLHNQDYTCL